MPKKQTEWSRAYNAKAYDRLNIVIPRGRKADIEAFAILTGESVNGLINSLLREAVGMSEEEWKRKEADDE